MEKERGFEDVRIAELLSDVYRVGADKPLGYVALRLVESTGISLSRVQADLKQRGIASKVFSEKECPIAGGALYAYHHKALRKLLESNKQTLRDAKWPETPRKFVNYVATQAAALKTPLFDLVADAFGNKTNPMRTDVNDATP